MKKTMALLLALALLLGAAAMAEALWTCPDCGAENSGNFCGNCGAARPVLTWTCPDCGAQNEGNFCGNCGARRPEVNPAPIDDGVTLDALQAAARDGDADAMVELGARCEEGYGVEQSYTMAAHWYRRAAKVNSAEGWYRLGWLYAQGLGESQSYENAAACWLKASKLDHADAMLCLAELYEQGAGVEKSSIQAQRYRDKAAEALAQPSPTPAPTPKPTPKPTVAPVLPAEYVGVWDVIQFTSNGNSVYMSAGTDSYMRYELNADGTAVFTSSLKGEVTTQYYHWRSINGKIAIADMVFERDGACLVFESDTLGLVLNKQGNPPINLYASVVPADMADFIGTWEVSALYMEGSIIPAEYLDNLVVHDIGAFYCTTYYNGTSYDSDCEWVDGGLMLYNPNGSTQFFSMNDNGCISTTFVAEDGTEVTEYFERIS